MPETPEYPVLHLEHIEFRGQHRKPLVHDVSLSTAPRHITMVIGANGAGKTLLLKLGYGLLQPHAGQVRWTGPPNLRKAFVFQTPVLLQRSVAANINLVLKAAHVPRALRRHRRNEALETASLVQVARQHARHLSSGEQQRLAIARAWAIRPQVLFLDEPAANLDPIAQHAIENLIHTINDHGCKIIMTTHDLGHARRSAGEIIFLHHGQLLEHAPAPAFFAQPNSSAAKHFLAIR